MNQDRRQSGVSFSFLYWRILVLALLVALLRSLYVQPPERIVHMMTTWSLALPRIADLGRRELLTLAIAQFPLLALAYTFCTFAVGHLERIEHPLSVRAWLQRRFFKPRLKLLLGIALVTLWAALTASNDLVNLALYASAGALGLGAIIAYQLYSKVSRLDSPEEILALAVKQLNGSFRRFRRLRSLSVLPESRFRLLVFTLMNEDLGEGRGPGTGFAHLIERIQLPSGDLFEMARGSARTRRAVTAVSAIGLANDKFRHLYLWADRILGELASERQGAGTYATVPPGTKGQINAVFNSFGSFVEEFARTLRFTGESAIGDGLSEIERVSFEGLTQALNMCRSLLRYAVIVNASDAEATWFSYRILRPAVLSLRALVTKADGRGGEAELWVRKAVDALKVTTQ